MTNLTEAEVKVLRDLVGLGIATQTELLGKYQSKKISSLLPNPFKAKTVAYIEARLDNLKSIKEKLDGTL